MHDTDDDGLNDGDEYKLGTNPNNQIVIMTVLLIRKKSMSSL